MHKIITFVPALLLLAGSAGAAGSDSTIDWIAGHWCGEFGDDTIEEIWLQPHGGVAVGLGRSLKGDKTTGFEYFRIADIEGVRSFIAQPGGQPPTVFKKTDDGESWVRFENPDHDFPRKIEYRRNGDTLHAEVSGPGGDGSESVIHFEYHLCDL